MAAPARSVLVRGRQLRRAALITAVPAAWKGPPLPNPLLPRTEEREQGNAALQSQMRRSILRSNAVIRLTHASAGCPTLRDEFPLPAERRRGQGRGSAEKTGRM